MPVGKIYKYNKNRKFSVIRPKEWKTQRQDVLFESIQHACCLGDNVEYDVEYRNGKGYATNIKKIDA